MVNITLKSNYQAQEFVVHWGDEVSLTAGHQNSFIYHLLFKAITWSEFPGSRVLGKFS